jgi:hypothetical protein
MRSGLELEVEVVVLQGQSRLVGVRIGRFSSARFENTEIRSLECPISI